MGWIDCKKRLPYIEAEVIVCTSKYEVTTGHYFKNDKTWKVHGENREDIIYWQGLPGIPKNLPMRTISWDDLEYNVKGNPIIPPRTIVE